MCDYDWLCTYTGEFVLPLFFLIADCWFNVALLVNTHVPATDKSTNENAFVRGGQRSSSEYDSSLSASCGSCHLFRGFTADNCSWGPCLSVRFSANDTWLIVKPPKNGRAESQWNPPCIFSHHFLATLIGASLQAHARFSGHVLIGETQGRLRQQQFWPGVWKNPWKVPCSKSLKTYG